MKLNGALKPHHGASVKGSSTGAGPLMKYRDKRYPKDNCENVTITCLSLRQKGFQYIRGNSVNANTTVKRNSSSHSHHKDNSFKNHHIHEPEINSNQIQQSCWDQKQRHSGECDGLNLNSTESEVKKLTINSNETANTKPQNCGQSVVATRPTTSGITITITDCSNNVLGGTSSNKTLSNEPAGISGNQDNRAGITLKQQERQPQATNKCGDNPKQNVNNTSRREKPSVEEELPVESCHAIPPTLAKDNASSDVRKLPHCWKELQFNNLSLFGGVHKDDFSPIQNSRFLQQFESVLLWLRFLMFSSGSTMDENYSGCGSDGRTACSIGPVTQYSSLEKIMRVSQSFIASLDRFCFKNANKSRPPPTAATNTTPAMSAANTIAMYLLAYGVVAILLLPQPVYADDNDNFYSPNGIIIGETTTEFGK